MISKDAFFVSAVGGTLEAMRPGGEIVLEVAIPSGKVPAREFLDLLEPDWEIRLSERVYVVEPRRLVGVIEAPNKFESGANADFTPNSPEYQSAKIEALVSNLSAQSARLQAQVYALSQRPDPVFAPVALLESEPKADGL